MKHTNLWNGLGAATQALLGQASEAIGASTVGTQSVAYVLLDGKEANPLTGTDARLRPVPDIYFSGEPWLAPQLLPLNLPDDVFLLQDALAAAALSASQRMQVQPVAAVVIAGPDVSMLLMHLAGLGLQYDPVNAEEPARLFRYQDPRVMQRVWPRLSEPQRRAWLGPVLRWYAIEQPTGSLPADAVELVVWQAGPAPRDDAAHPRLHHLFDERQWRLAHGAPAENAFWLYAAADREALATARVLPDLATLRQWLAEAGRHGLHADDQTGWALCRWATSFDEWTSPSGQARMHRALGLQQEHAGLGFADAWHTAGRRAKPA